MPHEPQAPRPASCAGCVFYPAGGLCRRHAPSPTTEEFELTHWPPVRPVDRCGSGIAVTDGDGAGVTMCEAATAPGLPPPRHQTRSADAHIGGSRMPMTDVVMENRWSWTQRQ